MDTHGETYRQTNRQAHKLTDRNGKRDIQGRLKGLRSKLDSRKKVNFKDQGTYTSAARHVVQIVAVDRVGTTVVGTGTIIYKKSYNNSEFDEYVILTCAHNVSVVNSSHTG